MQTERSASSREILAWKFCRGEISPTVRATVAYSVALLHCSTARLQAGCRVSNMALTASSLV